MKIDAFKQQLKEEVKSICDEQGWQFDNNKQRGQAFENWCFEFFNQSYNEIDNRLEDCVFRNDDFSIDVFFPSKEFKELYLIQCKYRSISSSTRELNRDEVELFFSRYSILSGKEKLRPNAVKSDRTRSMVESVKNFLEEGYALKFIFITTEKCSERSKEIIENYAEKFQNESATFEIWDIYQLKDEFIRLKSVEESYPDEVSFTLATDRFIKVTGPENHLTFALPATELRQLFVQYRQRLFNWNIRCFLGKKGVVNKGLVAAIEGNPEEFYYLNNGISALCESFEFDCSAVRFLANLMGIDGQEVWQLGGWFLSIR